MSSGSLKGLEVVLIAGLVFWFAYSQLNALKRSKPTDSPSTDEETKEARDRDTPASKPD